MTIPSRRLLLLLLWVAAGAGAAPKLDEQAAWTDADKKAFLEFLDTGKGPPSEGQVREVRQASVNEAPVSRPRGYGSRPFYLSLELATGALSARASGAAVSTEGFEIGPRLTAGWHLFSWMRYWAGLEYKSLSGFGHFHVPLGLELALIPLGMPHTQYVVLRAGLGLHGFATGASADANARSLEGLRASWDLALGYEWQVFESGLRIHALAETQLGAGFWGAGLTAGVAYMF